MHPKLQPLVAIIDNGDHELECQAEERLQPLVGEISSSGNLGAPVKPAVGDEQTFDFLELGEIHRASARRRARQAPVLKGPTDSSPVASALGTGTPRPTTAQVLKGRLIASAHTVQSSFRDSGEVCRAPGPRAEATGLFSLCPSGTPVRPARVSLPGVLPAPGQIAKLLEGVE
jgi:hypothetical protein